MNITSLIEELNLSNPTVIIVGLYLKEKVCTLVYLKTPEKWFVFNPNKTRPGIAGSLSTLEELKKNYNIESINSVEYIELIEKMFKEKDTFGTSLYESRELAYLNGLFASYINETTEDNLELLNNALLQVYLRYC